MLEQAKRPASALKSASAPSADAALRRPIDREVDPFGPKLESPPAGPQSFSEDKAPTGAEAQAHEIGEAIASDLPRGLKLSSGAVPSAVSEVAERHVGVSLGSPQMNLGGDGQRVAKQQGAIAVAEGDTVHVAAGEVSTGTEHGRSVLGHELTHVAQQRVHGRTARQGVRGTPETYGLKEAQKSEGKLTKYLGTQSEQKKKTKLILDKKHPKTPEDYEALEPDLQSMVRLTGMGLMAAHRATLIRKRDAFVEDAKVEMAAPGVASQSPLADLRMAATALSQLKEARAGLELSKTDYENAKARAIGAPDVALELLFRGGIGTLPAHVQKNLATHTAHAGPNVDKRLLAEGLAHSFINIRVAQIAGVILAEKKLYEAFPPLSTIVTSRIADAKGASVPDGKDSALASDEALAKAGRESYAKLIEANKEAIALIASGDIHAFDMPRAVSATMGSVNPDVQAALRWLRERRQMDQFWTDMIILGVTAAVVCMPVVGPAAVAVASGTYASKQVTDLFSRTTVTTASANPHENVLGMTKPETWEWVLAGVMAILSVAGAGFALKGMRNLRPRGGVGKQSAVGEVGPGETVRLPRSLGAAAKQYNVRGARELLSNIRNAHPFKKGHGIREVGRLVREHGGKAANWRKMKGFAEAVKPSGATGTAEIHWYQCHGVGRVELKVKTWLN